MGVLYLVNLGVFRRDPVGVLREYCPVLQTTQSLYNHSERLVHIAGNKSELFLVGDELCPGCLFITFSFTLVASGSRLVFEEKVVLLASSHLRGDDRWIGALQ